MTERNRRLISWISVISAVCILLTSMSGLYTVFAADVEYGIAENTNCETEASEDGSFRIKPTAAQGNIIFDPAFKAEKNAESECFPGTATVISEPMIMLSIEKAGDLKGYLALKWEGCGNYGWLIIKDRGSEDGVNTTIRVSYYNGKGEYTIKDYSYVYGCKIFAFVRYSKDVNRWSLAIQKVDGLYNVYSEDWHAMNVTMTAVDATPRRAILAFESVCEGVTAKIATKEDIDFNVDPEGVLMNSVSGIDNGDGTHTLTSEAARASVVFNRSMIFTDNTNELVFEGTERKVPENALEFSIDAKGDLSSWMGIGAVGSTPSYMLFFRDRQTGDEETTTLRVSGYDDKVEYGAFDIPYSYGMHVYVWMRYGTDVNRWIFAVEQPDGTYIVYAKDILAYTMGASDYAAAKRLKIVFANPGSKITAAALEQSELPGVKPKENFDIMNAVDNGGVITLSHDGSAVYTFEDYLTFETTNLTYTATSTAIPKNVLCLTLQADSLAPGKYLGVRLLEENDVESAKLAAYTLRIRIVSDNGDGTGILGMSVYHSASAVNADFKEIEYKFGDPIYIAPSYRTDVNRWRVAVPNVSGMAYRTYSVNLWHSDSPGVNSTAPYIPYRISLISYNGVKNMTAAIQTAEQVIQNKMPPVPTDTAFTGSGFTEEIDESGYYKLTVGSAAYACSTWTTDLTKGLIFRINDFGKTWVSLRLSGDYWKMPEGALGGAVEDQYTLLIKNRSGSIYVSLWNGSTEIGGTNISGVSSTSTHILSVRKVTTSSVGTYYKLTLDGKDIVPMLSIMESSFNVMNNYDPETKTYGGAYFRFGTSSDTVVISSIRTFESGEEKEINGWITNTKADVSGSDNEGYSLDMDGYSSLKLGKMANLASGIIFKIDNIEEQGQFGLAFSMLKGSASLDIPPALSNDVDVYYSFNDNGDGTVTVLSSAGYSSTVTMDIAKKHTYSIVEVVTTSGDTEYTLAIDGQAVFSQGMTYETFVQLNNGSLGTYPTVFTKSALKISGFNGEFTTPAVSTDDDSLWDDDWSDDSDDDAWSDDWSDDWNDDWSGDSDDENEWTEVEEAVTETKLYKKVLKRVKIEQDPIIVEYSLWWLWLIIAAVAVGAATITVIIVRKKRKLKK